MSWLSRRKIMAGGTLLIVTAMLILFESARRQNRDNPRVKDKRMSEWAFALVAERYQTDEYRVKPGYMEVFRAQPDAAIHHLTAVIHYRPSTARIVWTRHTSNLPRNLRGWLALKPRLIQNRWAAVLALAELARDRPDPRLPPIFLSCMTNENVAVRKIAAYEASPRLSPHDPTPLVQILTKALGDSNAQVRRDGCRRIVATVRTAKGSHSDALLVLLPTLRQLAETDSQNHRHVTNAIQHLSQP